MADKKVIAIDIGGSHVKIMANSGGQVRKFVSGPEMTAETMANALPELWEGLEFDAISMGYPGPVIHNRILAEPHNLAPGWRGYDFEKHFGKPVRIINDALMQAIGSYDGGRMLFLGLGTGLGAAMIVENVAQPMELAHLPFKKGRTYEEYLGEASLEKRGHKKWKHHVFDAVDTLTAALQPDYVVIGGGNVDHLKELPPNARRGDNANAFKGGFALWTDEKLVI
ncbi:hypothetical protein GCM10007989_16250 [Devosia pacifica]|uniref:ROK family protein n=1 Tax=Devosia pacifica TaxID=1335967 RepID=A0A918VRA5_9HYPH|nr:ROK family protein [Devosia pacifica]GHA21667.1 hypothetical protein GCM10007989_16250 [Devosia pacifica]